MSDVVEINEESAELDKIDMTIEEFGEIEPSEKSICGLIEWVRNDGRTKVYVGIRIGTIEVIFSRGGRVTGRTTNQISPDNIYRYTPLQGGSVGFRCR
jgi:hypothetical protein